MRTVDPAQFQRLLDTYDYDMIVVAIGASESPGNEQTGYWTCDSVKPEGGYNMMGVCSPVIDDLVHRCRFRLGSCRTRGRGTCA